MKMTYDDGRIMQEPRQFWDDRYAKADFAYGCERNDFLAEQA